MDKQDMLLTPEDKVKIVASEIREWARRRKVNRVCIETLSEYIVADLNKAEAQLAKIAKLDRPDREKIACLICGRRTSASCMLVVKEIRCHWCKEALEKASQLLALFPDVEEIRKYYDIAQHRLNGECAELVIQAVKKERKRIRVWGNEKCTEHRALLKHSCPECWQALKQEGG